jgi:hypothetical protein
MNGHMDYLHGIGVGSYVYLRRVIKLYIIEPAHQQEVRNANWNESDKFWANDNASDVYRYSLKLQTNFQPFNNFLRASNLKLPIQPVVKHSLTSRAWQGIKILFRNLRIGAIVNCQNNTECYKPLYF